MAKGMLIDSTRCIGCRGCQVACKSWKELPAGKSAFSPTSGNPQHLDANNFTRVLFRETSTPSGGVRWSFVKRQCMHCLEPACTSACPVGALVKLTEGPVLYRDDRCIGCRYCMVACPFSVPKYEWSSAVPYVRKCDLCADRLAMGQAPACVTTCPTEALLFGDRDELLAEAHRRIDTSPGKYAPTVYGEKTAGGTAVLYLTALPLEALGLELEGFRTDLGEVPYGRAGHDWMAKVPWVAVTVGGAALGLYHLNRRRDEVRKQDGKEG